ncbi:MAG: T9SS type A sorting domain-containing protein [Bacteroidales bacterium]|nr:T9SS type A sorting domain-containing protein [Bacteroidales bacterium]
MMKQIALILVLFFTLQQSYSYNWESYGPEGIKANNLCLFWPDYGHVLICSDSGMFLNTNSRMLLWEYFDYPAKDATQLNNNTILFVAGNGSYSDGIYSINLQTYQIDVIQYCINPNFIKYYEPGVVFYVGYENGLLKSEDGLNWEEVSYFAGKNCVDMEFNYDHIIVNVSADLTHLYLSGNSGSNWTEASGCPGWIRSMAFHYGANVYGIFPDNSYSSGLWYSDDYGNNWENEFYSVNMNTICDVDGESLLMIGWKYSGDEDEYEGIAVYDPDDPPPGLIFLNEGLPNTNINKIKYQPFICTGALIYVCTDEGVYVCGDYFVGINEHFAQYGSINVFPNPVIDRTIIKVNLPDLIDNDNSIIVLDNHGQKVDEIKFETNSSIEFEIKWNKGDLPAGVYYLVIKTKKETQSEKFIIL